jgi:hypothetical protein
MKSNPSYRVFISHATQDWPLAKAVKQLIWKSCAISEREIFLTSDYKCLGGGKKEEKQITTAFHQAEVIVALVTPHSVLRPWVLSETGAAHFHGRKALFVLIAQGITTQQVPEPMRLWHMNSLYKEADISNFCRSLTTTLGKMPRKPNCTSLKRTLFLAQQSSGNWKGVGNALVAENTLSSPFNLLNILADGVPQAARSEVVLIGQNLFSLTRLDHEENFRKCIFAWLRRSNKRKFKVMICRRDDKRLMQTYAHVFGKEPLKQLASSTNVFKRWVKIAKKQGLNFSATTVRIFPPSLMFVDPETDDGYLVLTPRMKPPSPDRPHFVVAKQQHEGIFTYYWLHYSDTLRQKEGCLA